jgi:hypothetical protein
MFYNKYSLCLAFSLTLSDHLVCHRQQPAAMGVVAPSDLRQTPGHRQHSRADAAYPVRILQGALVMMDVTVRGHL